MSYGVNVYTSEGLVTTDSLNSAQLISIVQLTGSSGTVSAPPEYAETTGTIYIDVNDGKFPPTLTFSSATNSYSWSNIRTESSVNFNVYFFRVF